MGTSFCHFGMPLIEHKVESQMLNLLQKTKQNWGLYNIYGSAMGLPDRPRYIIMMLEADGPQRVRSSYVGHILYYYHHVLGHG